MSPMEDQPNEEATTELIVGSNIELSGSEEEREEDTGVGGSISCPIQVTVTGLPSLFLGIDTVFSDPERGDDN